MRYGLLPSGVTSSSTYTTIDIVCPPYPLNIRVLLLTAIYHSSCRADAPLSNYKRYCHDCLLLHDYRPKEL